jgi:hypothetical protein
MILHGGAFKASLSKIAHRQILTWEVVQNPKPQLVVVVVVVVEMTMC